MAARVDTRTAMPDPVRIAARVAEVRAEIAAACARVGRDPAGVRLVAVTKTQEADVLPALRAAGVRDFGENRIEHLAAMRLAAEAGDRWHFIGRVQGRQLPRVAELAHELHSLCDPDHVGRLARACTAQGRSLPVHLQINTSGEASKAGVAPETLPTLLALARSSGLAVVGLMTMAPELGVHADATQVRACFARLRGLAQAHGLASLSMGMSGDLGLAVEEGATVVRVGSRLFA